MSWIITGTEKYETDPYQSQVSLLLHGDGSDGSTTIVDSSPSPKSVTAFGDAQISTAQSKFGGSSLAFDGNGDYLSAPWSTQFDFGSEDFTIELWIYRLDSLNRALFAIAESGTKNGISLQIVNNKVYVLIGEGNAISTSTQSPILDSGWVHIALVRFNGVFTCYSNGAAGSTASPLLVNAAPSLILIGTGYGLSGGNFNPTSSFYGYIDDLRITKGIARYTSNFTPPTAPFPDI